MPKQIVTKASLPRILRELDRWQGKLTWPLFCERVAKVLNVASVSKHTMYLYPVIKESFQRRQKALKETRHVSTRDVTLEFATRRIAELEAEVKRLEVMNTRLLEQFERWQYNAYAHGVRMDQLAWDKALPEVNRSGHRKVPMKEGKGAKNS